MKWTETRYAADGGTTAVRLCALERDEDYPPSGLNDFAAWLAAVMSEIPAQYRDGATITFGGYSSGCSDYGCMEHESSVTVEYWKLTKQANKDLARYDANV